ncbi:MAG: TatD family hydrolase [Patescibacteria group bacterium]|nr:TatD family hydrolase [Patescibacteria group bacterium]
MFVDTHAHVNFNAFSQDADEVIRRSLAGDTWMVLVGSEYKTSKKALDYANRYEKGVYAAVGLHPVHLDDLMVESDDENGEYSFRAKTEEFNYDNYEKLAKFEKAVAIGEIGLDYYHINLAGDVSAIKKKQREIFESQLLLARHLDLPAIIHCRQAHDDMLAVLADFKKKRRDMIPADRPWGVMHCFSGDEDLAWKYFSLGLIISFTGLVTFSKRWDDLIRKMPPEKFMIETDCPYMTPEPYRGKRNEPLLVKRVAARIGEIRNLSPERVGEITTKNAREFFGI